MTENNDAQIVTLGEDDTFRFRCAPDVPCFNECCRDLNQFLFPYDILRLRAHFKIPTHIFLAKYTSSHTGPESGLPVVTLRPNADAAQTCPFVSKAGCRVYADRPASCRIYPLARAVSRNRRTGQIQEHFAHIKEPHCQGHKCTKTWTPRQWMDSQRLDEYNRINDQMMALVSHKNQYQSEPLDLVTTRMVYTACYDIDTFRDRIMNHGWGEKQIPDTETRLRLAKDDRFLLNFGINWVKEALLNP